MTSISSVLPHASPSQGIRTLARFGFAAKGAVYLTMGILALLAATGLQGGKTADKQQAVQTIQDLPMGRFLLGLIALGLAGYVIWRFTQALRDTENKGHGAKGIARRVGYAASGLVYVALAFYAGKAAWQNTAVSSGGGGNSKQSMVATLLEQSYGPWLVGAIGLVIIGTGIYQMWRAYSGKFAKHVNASSLPAEQQKIVFRTGQIGYTARGIVMAIVGYFFVQAARHSNAGEVNDTEGAFDLLSTMGPAVLGVVALGLVAYGVYMIVQARFPVLNGV
jgi:TRAP-type C4-dicarboxylate transport system permease small subunit